MTETTLTVKEVSSFLKVSQQMVYNLIRDEELPAFKVGTAMRVLQSDLETYIDRQKNHQASAQRESGAAGREGSLSVHGLCAHLGNFRLQDISFELPLGSSLGIAGSSGSGKTLLLKTMAGLIRKDSGGIFLGADSLDRPEDRSQRIGFVFQDYALYPKMTGAGNIAFPSEVAGDGKAQTDAKVREIAQRLKIAPEYLEKHISALPAGVKQLVALARAENRTARLFLMDEPLVHLDPDLRRNMRALLGAVRRELGITTVYGFNEPDDALALCEWLLVLDAGRILQFGPAETVYHEPASAQVMELFSPDGLNKVKVDVKGGLSLPWGLPAPVADGAWLLCFRPAEVEADPAGPIKLRPDYAVVRDGSSRMASARLEGGSELRFVIPEAQAGEASFRPLAPRFFKAD